MGCKQSKRRRNEGVQASSSNINFSRRSGRRGRRPGYGGAGGGGPGIDRQGYLDGLVGGEQESVDRIFTGQISGFLNGNLDGTNNNNIQYGFESSCPDGVDQNTALLATAAAIAVGAGVIYRAVTLQQAGRRRRDAPDHLDTITGRVKDLVMLGLENIEEYINDGEPEGNRIDIHEYINQFSRKYLRYT